MRRDGDAPATLVRAATAAPAADRAGDARLAAAAADAGELCADADARSFGERPLASRRASFSFASSEIDAKLAAAEPGAAPDAGALAPAAARAGVLR